MNIITKVRNEVSVSDNPLISGRQEASYHENYVAPVNSQH